MGNKKIVILIVAIIAGISMAAIFYVFNSKKTPSSASSLALENKITVAEKEPSKTLKVYTDSAGFSFKYPEDVQVSKKDTANDPTAYADLEIISNQAKGSILLKVLDTKLKSIDDWFLENKLISIKEIKIGEISGKETNMNGKIIAVGLDQDILFTIEVDSQNQKYWVDIYQTLLSTFNFVSQQPQESLPASSSDDVILEEETVE